MSKRKWVSDIIGVEYKNWRMNDIIYIEHPTGSGKSYFIRNQLSKWAEINQYKILLLVNRSLLKQQVNETLQMDGNNTIEVMTYQMLESKLNKEDSEFTLDDYQIIVADECAYFYDDSTFSEHSDQSLDAIANQSNCMKIFISATGRIMYNYINREMNPEKLIRYPKRFREDITIDSKIIKSLKFYNNQVDLDFHIQEYYNNPDHKIIHFCNSVDNAYNLHSLNNDSNFMCGKSNKKYYKHSQNCIESIDDKITFNNKTLYTTKVLDNGVDLKDDNIKLIVCDEIELNTIIQCIGRKRMLHSRDKVDIIIKNHNNSTLNGYVKSLKDKLDEVHYFTSNSYKNYIKKYSKYGTRSKGMIYDHVDENGVLSKKVSKVRYYKTMYDYGIFTEMFNMERENIKSVKSKSTAFSNYMYRLLKEDGGCVILNSIKKKIDLEEYLESIVDKPMLTVKDRQELINKMNVRSNKGRILKGIEVLNSSLKEDSLKYSIVDYRTTRKIENKINHYHNAWMVVKIED